MKMGHFWLVAVLVGSGLARRSGKYRQCMGGVCRQVPSKGHSPKGLRSWIRKYEWGDQVGDAEVSWEFDQPQPFHLGRGEEGRRIQQELEAGDWHIHDRLDLKIQAVSGDDDGDTLLPPDIHMIWLGSPLPERHTTGPRTFAQLNPGHTVHLWLDHPSTTIQEGGNIKIHNVTEQVWQNVDLLRRCTNFAMMADILRMEIVQRFGGIYVDIDTTALRSFGPIFHKSFLCLRESGWMATSSVYSVLEGDVEDFAGLDNWAFGFPRNSSFLAFALAALRQNFVPQENTLYITGPVFLKEVLLQYKHASSIQLISSDYLGRPSKHSIFLDSPGSDWSMEQDVSARNPFKQQQKSQ